ncbi:hypothetical protein DFR50_1312 [Roseiarcus fermentans]|uniref:Uncharacterized protein n=1 Tax=Roseiarcus fermentans TaxID=1473586 RepID=A0A366EVH0_9HYPH|nr:hypothetical protein DFR50_1312 [Roseiarcus fermentans]
MQTTPRASAVFLSGRRSERAGDPAQFHSLRWYPADSRIALCRGTLQKRRVHAGPA